jgi:hypothetical protein
LYQHRLRTNTHLYIYANADNKRQLSAQEGGGGGGGRHDDERVLPCLVMRAGAASAIVRARLVASTEVSAVPGGGCEVLGPLRLPRNCPHLEYEITNPKYGKPLF